MSRSRVPSRSSLSTPLGARLGNIVHLIGCEWVPRLPRYLVHNRFCSSPSPSLLRRSSFLGCDCPRQSLPFTIASLLPWGEPLNGEPFVRVPTPSGPKRCNDLRRTVHAFAVRLADRAVPNGVTDTTRLAHALAVGPADLVHALPVRAADKKGSGRIRSLSKSFGQYIRWGNRENPITYRKAPC